MANTNLTPRQRFQATVDNLAPHHRMIELPAFERACDCAILELQNRLATDQTSAPADGRFFMLAGASEVIKILWGLAEPTAKSQGVVNDNLEHRI